MRELLSPEARELLREYDRQYYASHREQAYERKRRYLERKAAKLAAEKVRNTNAESNMGET